MYGRKDLSSVWQIGCNCSSLLPVIPQVALRMAYSIHIYYLNLRSIPQLCIYDKTAMQQNLSMTYQEKARHPLAVLFLGFFALIFLVLIS